MMMTHRLMLPPFHVQYASTGPAARFLTGPKVLACWVSHGGSSAATLTAVGAAHERSVHRIARATIQPSPREIDEHAEVPPGRRVPSPLCG